MAREPTEAPSHLRLNAPISDRVLLPDDPGCALRIAQVLMTDTPKMLNHNRGLWGYGGTGSDGEPLTIQSTGVGGPAAAIVVEELIGHGARRLVRVGHCRALSDAVAPHTVVLADPVFARDGTSTALGAPGTLRPDPLVAEPILATGVRAVAAISTDHYYGPAPGGAEVWDLESGAVLAAAAALGASAAVVLVVTGDPELQHEDEIAAARVAAAAFGL
jgi:uridine phosphorylase